MKKIVVVAVAILALIPASVFGFSAPKPSEFGLGLTASYPVGYAFYYQANFGGLPEPWPMFWGATVKWKPGALVLDLGMSYWSGFTNFDFWSGTANFIYGYLGAGFALDLWIFRFWLGGSIDVVNVSVPGDSNYSAFGVSAKTSLDLKLGPVTVGVSMAFPLDLLASMLAQGSVYEGDNLFRIFAGQASVNVVYWFGGKRKSQ